MRRVEWQCRAAFRPRASRNQGRPAGQLTNLAGELANAMGGDGRFVPQTVAAHDIRRRHHRATAAPGERYISRSKVAEGDAAAIAEESALNSTDTGFESPDDET